MIGAAKGVIRSMLCNGELKSEVVPVDLAINGLVVMPHYLNQLETRPAQIPVFNVTIDEERKRTWQWVMEKGKAYGLKYPFLLGLWYPDGNMTMNRAYHWFCVVMFMWLPAYLVDFLFFIFRQKRFMVHVQTRIATGLEVLQFFTTRAWDFKSQCYQQLRKGLTPRDRVIFKMDQDGFDDEEYLRTTILGGRQYVMKEDPATIPRARQQLKVMYAIDRICKTLIVGGLSYWLACKIGLVGFVEDLF